MEDKLLLLLALAVSVLIAVVFSKLVTYATKPRLNLPPGPWTLPVIGSIHHLVGSHAIHRSMRRLAEKHGPLMQVWLGEVPAVVVSSPEAAQDVLRNQDLAFADRYVSTTIATIYLGGKDLAFAPYGERWRQLRKLCTQQLLTAARVRSFRRVREEEVARLVRDLAASAAAREAVNLTARMAELVNDIVVRCSIGGRSRYRDEFLDALRTTLDQTTWLTVADVFPSSKLARMLGTAPRKALASRKKIERILEQIIQERKQIKERSTGTGTDETVSGNECFLDVLLRLQKEGDTPIPITNETMMLLLHPKKGGKVEPGRAAPPTTVAPPPGTMSLQIGTALPPLAPPPPGIISSPLGTAASMPGIAAPPNVIPMPLPSQLGSSASPPRFNTLSPP